MSAISMTPAFNVWMPSPDSGTSASTVDSAVRATSSSVCPTPTVSIRTRSNPKASSRSATSAVVVARPPCAPRVAIERMKTRGSRLADSMRMRSPSRAPPVKGLVGSTATTPTPSPCARNCWISRSVSVLLPAPGGPVMPMRRVPPWPRRACTWDSRRSKPSRWFSTRLIARASAAGSRRSRPSTMCSMLMRRSCKGNHSRDVFRVEGDRPHETRAHGHPLDAGRRRGQDVELQSVEQQPLPGFGNPPERLHQEAAHRLDAPPSECDVERLFESARRSAPLELHQTDGGLGGRLRRLRREDFGHEIPQQVLQGDEPRGPAELVEHDREVAAAALHLQHEIGGADRARHD